MHSIRAEIAPSDPAGSRSISVRSSRRIRRGKLNWRASPSKDLTRYVVVPGRMFGISMEEVSPAHEHRNERNAASHPSNVIHLHACRDKKYP
jgi:hypothetical protein